MYNIMVVDDEKAARKEIIYFINKYFTNIEIREYSSGKDFITNCVKEEISLAFIDIHLGDIDGLTIARILKDVNSNVKIIFVSAYDEYALESYEIGIFDYLTKPLLESRFEHLVDRINKEGLNKNSVLTLTNNKDTHYINIEDIRYVESLNRKCYVYTEATTYITSLNLIQLELLLNKKFFRCHKAYIVNLSYVRSIRCKCNNQYELYISQDDTTMIPISRNKIRELRICLDNF